MKKLMLAIGLGLISGSVWAACIGPFCYDDRGASINGLTFDGNGNGLKSLTLTQINASTPTATGQMVYCSNCVNSPVCVSTGTTNFRSYVAVMSSGTVPGIPACN